MRFYPFLDFSRNICNDIFDFVLRYAAVLAYLLLGTKRGLNGYNALV